MNSSSLLRRMKKRDDMTRIDRDALLAAYDDQHEGEPGKARKLIDADELIEKFNRQADMLEALTDKADDFRLFCKLADAVEDAPTIDAVKVVRCKDCKHRDPEDKKCDCGNLHHAGTIFPVPDNYFCADGERRTE